MNYSPRWSWHVVVWLALWLVPSIGAFENEDAFVKKREEALKEHSRISGEVAKLNTLLLESQSDSAKKEWERTRRNFQALENLLSIKQAKLEDQQSLSKQVAVEKAELEKLEKSSSNEKKSYSFLTIESMQEEVEKEVEREAQGQIELESEQKQLDLATEHLVGRQKPGTAVKLKQPELITIETPAERVELKIASERVSLLELEIEIQKLHSELRAIIKNQLKRKIEINGKGSVFSDDDLKVKIDELKEQKRSLSLQIEEAETRLAKLLAPSRSHIASDLQPAPLDSSFRRTRIAANIYESQIAFLRQTSEILSEAQAYWKFRFEMYDSKSMEYAKLRKSKADLDTFRERVETVSQTLSRNRESTRSKWESESSKDSPESVVGAEVETDAEEAARFMDIHSAKMGEQLQKISFSMSRLSKELKKRIADSTTIWNVGVVESVKNLFSYEVVNVDDQGITVSRAIYLLFLILIGAYLSFFASKWLGRFVLPILGIKPGVAVAFGSIFRYLLCIVFGVVAFHWMGIPLTAFAFLGGAAAIAVGFGSQDVMNNFMSGIILLTEQPIRVGDVILLSENQCIVTHIGLRSTRLRNYQNHELTIPNTLLIEKLVINLTLSDNLLRLVVPLVVDRSEPIRESTERIISALKNESRIHQAMEPIVLLKEVDTYYLTFEAHFTIEFTDPMESLVAQSKILTTIGQLFPTVNPDAPNDDDGGSNDDDTSLSRGIDAGKLPRNQLEREIKRLQAVLVTKK